MLAKKKKLSKKEIKEDKLVTTFYEAKSFYEENQTKIKGIKFKYRTKYYIEYKSPLIV